jgi:hypothetical protein
MSAALASALQPIYCGVCEKPQAEWSACDGAACDVREPMQLESLADLLRPLPTVGASCRFMLGEADAQGVIVANVMLRGRVPGVFVELAAGETVAVPLTDLQVMR